MNDARRCKKKLFNCPVPSLLFIVSFLPPLLFGLFVLTSVRYSICCGELKLNDVPLKLDVAVK